MRDSDAKALSTVLDYLAKTILAAKVEILAELKKPRPTPRTGPKRMATPIKLARAWQESSRLRREIVRLHKLIDQQVNKLSK